MADLISKDAAIVAVRYAIRHRDCGAIIASPIFNAIESLHAVDAVEVVRCRDCDRRGDPGECPMCFFSEGDWDDYTSDDGYCDRGERREENAGKTD